jgi:hypothetical protein
LDVFDIELGVWEVSLEAFYNCLGNGWPHERHLVAGKSSPNWRVDIEGKTSP